MSSPTARVRAPSVNRPSLRPTRNRTRSRGLDLSRKSGLVSRFWARGPGLALRRPAARIAAFFLAHGGLVLGALLTAHWIHATPRLTGELSLLDGSLLALTGLAFGASLVARLRREQRSLQLDARPVTLWRELEVSALALAAIWSGLALSGGAASPLRPLLLLLVAVYLPWHGARACIVTVAGVLLSLLVAAAHDGTLQGAPLRVAAEGVFVVLFAALYDLALSGLVKSARGAARKGLDAYLAELEQRAREYRLIVSHDGPGDVEAGREKWLIASVAEVEAAVRGALEVAETALDCHTAAVYLLSPDGERMRLRECLTRSEKIRREPILAGEGLPGVVLSRGAPLRIHGEFRGAVHDEGSVRPRAFLGVPLLAKVPGREKPLPRGVLLVDRLEDRPFDESDEKLMTTLAREVLRAIEGERVLGYIRREKDEKARFFRAIEKLNLLSKPAEICEQVARQAQEVAPLDFVAVTLVREEGEQVQHKIVEALGTGSASLRAEVFADNAGLVANVVRLGSTLPGRDYHVMSKTVVFDEKLPLEGLSSLKVIPMTVGESVVGTLVCGAVGEGELGEEPVRMLGVLAMQAAGAIARGRLFEKTEELATTDGLTGLSNHRRFQEALDGHLAAARRYSRSCSLVITDVDHFKSVNDTYGHPVGDEVLRGFAAILRREARDTDVVARYGGEEFAVILPETDLEGARVIAERIRQAVEATVFHTELGPLQVTLSAGVASFPAVEQEKQPLIDHCDRALYAAKRGGRNRVVTADTVR
ncbi:MAG: diguanylate cyclase [Deltaproteobacteria bacterium]|nr:diguanylate cyclase [Deltaproteobacteria bacterium]